MVGRDAILDMTETNGSGCDYAAEVGPGTWVVAFAAEGCEADFVLLHSSESSPAVAVLGHDTGVDANAGFDIDLLDILFIQ